MLKLLLFFNENSHQIRKSISILILFLICFRSISLSQNLTGDLTDALDRSRYNIPTDQVFLHLDRNHYYTGDTIRFQAYIRDRKTGIICSESYSLYSLLLNQAQKTIDSARFRIVNSTASGWLKIPENIPPGFYPILAFTSMMMNYDPEFIFSATIRIDELKPDQVKWDKTSDNISSSSSEALSSQPAVDLRFLPEGGTFICRIPQRLAFNAVSSSGRILKVAGEITNQKGEKITSFHSGQFGPGLVELTPVTGDTYFATLDGKNYSGMKWSLPLPSDAGIALKVTNYNEGKIDVLVEGREVKIKAFLLAVTMNNSLIFSRNIRVDSMFRLSVNTENLPAGIAYITLYDNELNPVAERLIFINDHKKLNIEISSSSSVADSASESDLILNTTGNSGEQVSSIISIAVIDSVSGLCNSLPLPDIESTFLYDMDFRNNLPPSIKLLGLNNMDKETIDLLLMTYGWRRFTLKEISGNGQDKKLLDYDNCKIKNLVPAGKTKPEIRILTLEDASVITLPIGKNKEAVLQFDTLSDSVRQVMILADEKTMANLNSAKIEFPVNQSFIEGAKLIHADLKPFNIIAGNPGSDDQSGINIPTSDLGKQYFLPDNVINIEEVTVKAKRKPVPSPLYINKYEKLYQSGSVKTMTSKEFDMWPSLEYILASFNPYSLDMENKKVYLRYAPASKENGDFPMLTGQGDFSALFVLNDIPIRQSYETIEMIPPSEIASITVLKGTRGFTIYGSAAQGGVIFITTKTGVNDYRYKKNDDLMRPFRLFRSEIEYYIPPKEETDTLQRTYDYPTVLWESEVFINGKEPLILHLPHNILKSSALVFMNGVSSKSYVGSKKFRIK